MCTRCIQNTFVHSACSPVISAHAHLSPTATIIIAKWRMYILRKKYRQLRAARESLHMNTPVSRPLSLLPFFPSFHSSSFSLLLPLLPLFLPFIPPLFPPLLPPPPPPLPPFLCLLFSVRDCILQALEEDQGSAVHSQVQSGCCSSSKVRHSVTCTCTCCVCNVCLCVCMELVFTCTFNVLCTCRFIVGFMNRHKPKCPENASVSMCVFTSMCVHIHVCTCIICICTCTCM